MYEFLNKETDYEFLNKYQKIKAEWLENEKYSKSTKRTYWNLINRNICIIEMKKNKDLCDFTDKEIQEVLNSVDSNSIKTIISLKSIICSYVKAYSNRVVSEISVNTAMKYKSLDEFYALIESLKCSDIDKMLLVLARYGADTNNITNVKWSDIDIEKEILKLGIVELPLDSNFLTYLDRAYNCNSYDYKTSTVEYINHGYILKVSNKSEDKKLNRNTLYTRVNSICKNNGVQRISLTDLNSYRQYDLLFDKFNKNGKITYDDVRNVLNILCEKYTPAKEQYLKERFIILSGQ